MKFASCIACNRSINLGRKPRLWTFVKCKSCRIDFEIICLDPPILDWPLDEDPDGSRYELQQGKNRQGDIVGS